jgi:parallel beta-helix repeat protein
VTTANLVNVANGCNNITVENCTIEGTTSIAGWTVADWENNLGTVTDLYTNATNTTFFNDVLTNVGFGIALDQLSTGSMVSHCTVQEFYEDGMRGLSNNSTFAYNLVKDSYVQDSNHDDFLQSWSRGTDGVVGDGTVSNVTVIGNTFISQTDPNQPLPAPPMGVGCYDGMYSGWVVENNLIVSNTYHGISLYGAINCTVINNTAIENPVATVTGVTPWIMIFEHKTQSDGTAWPVASSGNTIRNNIATRSVGYQLAAAGVADHNIVGATYTKYFMNYANFDFAPSATSPLTGAGSSISAPTTDILGYLRTNPYDIGAYKYISPVTYASWAAANIPFGDTTTQSAVTAQDGLNNLYKYALGLNPTSNYNFGAASLPYVKLVPVSGASGADNFLALTFTGVATDVTYTVYATNDPTLPIGSWTQLYTFPSGGTTAPGTVTVTDTQGVSASASTTNKRFMRLFMTNP